MAITVTQINEFKKLLEDGKLIIGSQRTLKLLRQNKAAKVWLSANVDAATLDDIQHFAALNKIDVVQMQHSNIELGELCRKPFAVSVVSVPK